MEQQLSSVKRDQILIDEAREDNNSRKELAESLLQSNQIFGGTMKALSFSMMSVAESMSRSFELLTHAMIQPQQGMSQPSFTNIPVMPQPQNTFSHQFDARSHASYMGMMGQSSHHSQARGSENENNPFTLQWLNTRMSPKLRLMNGKLKMGNGKFENLFLILLLKY